MGGKSKADLADAVYRVHGGLSRRESKHLIDLILDRIRGSLARGRPVLISGFGTFRVQARRPRLGRNPRTGQTVAIAPARRPVFRPSRLMVRDLNARGARKDRADA
jgi:integration host factor subunit alpha